MNAILVLMPVFKHLAQREKLNYNIQILQKECLHLEVQQPRGKEF